MSSGVRARFWLNLRQVLYSCYLLGDYHGMQAYILHKLKLRTIKTRHATLYRLIDYGYSPVKQKINFSKEICFSTHITFNQRGSESTPSYFNAKHVE